MMIYLKLLLTAFFWGGTFIAGRIVAETVGPFSAALMRFSIASLCLTLFVLKRHGTLPRAERPQWIPLMLLGITGVFAYNYFFFKGLKIVHAGRAAVIIANNPIFIALMSAAIFKERLNRLQVLGIFLSVTGAIIVITRGQPAELLNEGIGRGEVYILACVASWVTFSLLGKKVLSSLSPLTAIFFASVIGSIALVIPALSEGLLEEIPNFRLLDWSSLLYLGFFGTVLGFVWYYDGIKAIGPTKAGLFINFVPVSAILLAYVFLSEPVTSSLLFGTLFVCLGVYLTNKKS